MMVVFSYSFLRITDKMGGIIYVLLGLAISIVQLSWCQMSDNDRIRLGSKTPTEESLELDDEEDHIANLKLIFEDNKREVRDDDLKEHDYDDDHINWKTDSIPNPYVNLAGRKSRTSIINFQELTLRNAIEMLRKQFLKPPTISFRRAKLENVYRRILSLVEKEENYSNNILVFFSTLLPTINENLRVSNDGILDHVTKIVDKILKTPVIPPYLERLTGISDLKEAFSFSYLYQEFNNTLELLGLEDNDFNRKLVTKYKESIKNFIELVKEDMHENIIPVDSIYFILDNLEEIAPFIESQSQVEGNYAGVPKLQSFRDRESKGLLEKLGFRTRKNEDLEAKEIKDAEESLKIMLEYLVKMGIIETFTNLFW